MPISKSPVEDDAQIRAGQTLWDGSPIADRDLLLRCANEIKHLRAALVDIATNGQRQGGSWVSRRAQEAMEPPE